MGQPINFVPYRKGILKTQSFGVKPPNYGMLNPKFGVFTPKDTGYETLKIWGAKYPRI